MSAARGLADSELDEAMLNGIETRLDCTRSDAQAILQARDMRTHAALPDLIHALRLSADFIENVTDDDPERTSKFFAWREATRAAIAKATS